MSPTTASALSSLASHPIFTPAEEDQEEWQILSTSSEGPVGPKNRRIAFSGKELYVAVGREVRFGHVGDGDSYSVLQADHLNFEIHTLRLHSTGRLLAVIGSTQATVLLLPKLDPAHAKSPLICGSIPIDPYTFSPSSPHTIVDAHWHPLSPSSGSLWLLTGDGKLREYNLQTPTSAVQTFTILPPQSASSRFSAADPLARYATSFSFGPRSMGWGQVTVWVLLANGDIYSMGPIMPSRAEVGLGWVQGLKGYVDAEEELSGATTSSRGGSRAREWVGDLVRQAAASSSVASTAQKSAQSSPRQSILSGRPRSTPPQTPAHKDEVKVKLHTPQLKRPNGTALGVARQGPWILDPAPEEGDEEDIAVDLAVISARGDGETDEKGEGETVIAVAWSSGRVDLGVPLDTIRPRWDDEPNTPPTLAVIESIQLDLTNDEEMMADNIPYFSHDPLHSDTLYLAHLSGVDSINVSPWLAALATDEPELPPSDVTRVISTSSSDGGIEGFSAFWNAALGYALLGVSASGRAQVMELDYRIGDLSVAISSPAATKSTSGGEEQDKRSLLSGSPFNIDDILRPLRGSSSAAAIQAALAKLPSARKPVTEVSSEHLRAMGTIVAALENRIQAIRKASALVENRLALQIAELQRQIKVYNDCYAKIVGWKNDGGERVEQLLESQDSLSQRLDRVLAKRGNPTRQISEEERKWFEELEKVKVRINGSGSSFGLGRTRGLEKRVKQVREQLTALRATVGPKGAEGDLGGLEETLSQREEELRRLMKRMDDLTVRLEKAEGSAGSSPA